MPRPIWLAIVDRASVAFCVVAWTAVVLRLAPIYSPEDPGSAGILVLGCVIGYLLADFFSGLVHWLADRYFDPGTPILGPALIAPFREHHADAMAMTRHDFFEISGNNGLGTLPIAALLYWAPLPAGFAQQLLASSLAALGLSVIATNQFHCWAHVERPPSWVRRLQSLGLILRPEHHALHHAKEHDRAYCVTSGWLNPLLDRIDFFARLERAIDKLGHRPGSAT